MDFKKLIKISRPRFWLYTLGPFLFGYIAGYEDIYFWKNWMFWVYFIFFLIPANIIIYGVNDLSDEDTDQYNPKKGEDSYESRLEKTQKKSLQISVASSIIVALVISLSDPLLLMLMVLFLFLSVYYSAQPFRFKAKPFIDAYSNFLYFTPALIGYTLTTSTLPSPIWWLIGGLWVAGMHTYSAIPDIKADSRAGLNTTAVFLGKNGALIFVALNWLLFSILLIMVAGPIFLVALIYPLMPLFLLNKSTDSISKVYKFFPYINGILGFLGFWYIFFTKFSIEEVWESLPL